MTASGVTVQRGEERPPRARWTLRLYVARETGPSVRAFVRLKRICEDHLAGQYEIEVVNVADDPQAAVDEQLLALPTVERRQPEPVRRVVGDLSNAARVLRGLGIESRPTA